MAPDRPFPPIVLDTTFHNLLSQDSNGTVSDSLCNIKPTADPQYRAVPLNKKYLITSAQASDGDDLAHLQLQNVSYLLSFWAGPMEVLLLASEGLTEDKSLSKKVIEQNAARAFGVLDESQRPRPRVFKNVEDLVKNNDTTANQTHWGFAVDFSERTSHVRHPDITYKLNSKKWLAQCPLRSANDKQVDCECVCPSHATGHGQWFNDADCGDCKQAVKNEINRVREIITSRELPFVLKLTQSLGSVGTFLVRSEDDRKDALDKITNNLQEYLPLLTTENAHIHPTALVISDFLPGKTMAINFFIRPNGSPVFLGACHQLSTRGGDGGRQQTALTWSDQAELEKRYQSTLEHIGQVLHDEGYYGPAGADIMETEDGTQFVIDLNVRSATSLILGLLRGHCEKRGFNASVVFECLILGISREKLEETFAKEFEEGRIILLGTTKFGEKDIWAYPVVLTGEDQETVTALSERILEFEAMRSSETREAGGA